MAHYLILHRSIGKERQGLRTEEVVHSHYYVGNLYFLDMGRTRFSGK